MCVEADGYRFLCHSVHCSPVVSDKETEATIQALDTDGNGRIFVHRGVFLLTFYILMH
ncbi:hypothetical protein EXN66_Car019750 [Channa argus]|uniref:Uncharacterized protein n=1 Tax=Channa argus TaxID=215402 RepID=A0A6G1QNA3_CHAAH|nr:hypothetical protein EXN66_Car019750 [Channa argus]